MRLARVEAFLLHGRFTFVRVETEDGAVGWGEAAFHGRGVTADLTRSIGEGLVGRDASDISAIWRSLFQSGYRIGSTGSHLAAMAGIDIALHDLKGRVLGVPVWSLLGGRLRDSIPLYSSFMKRDLSAREEVERVEARLAQGWRSVKLHTGTAWGLGEGDDNTVGLVEAIRQAVGGRDRVRLLVDCNQAYTVHDALRVGRALERLEVDHFEEPIAPWDLEGYDRLQAALDVPLAAGEQEYNLWQFRDLVTRANIDILQPNVTSCGGFTQLMKIGALAEAFNRQIVCHNTEPTLMTAAHLHFAAASPMCSAPMEYFGESRHPLRDTTPVLGEPLLPAAGMLAVPDGPGLGVVVDEDTVRELDGR